MADNANGTLLESTMEGLGVEMDDLLSRLNPDPEKEAAIHGGAIRGPLMERREEGDGGSPPPDNHDTDRGDQGDPAKEYKVEGDFTAPTDEALEEAFRAVKKQRGRTARKKARLGRKRYKAMRAAILRHQRMYAKSAAGRRAKLKRKRREKKMGKARLARLHSQGKRVVSSSMGLEDRLRDVLSEGQGTDPKDTFNDVELLETGAFIAAILGDHFEDFGMEEDANVARTTSDRVVSLIEKYENENKFSVPDEEMVPAVKALGTVIDHYEKLGEADLPLAR